MASTAWPPTTEPDPWPVALERALTPPPTAAATRVRNGSAVRVGRAELTRGGLCSGWVEGGKCGPYNEARDPACVSRRVPAKLPDRVATVSTWLGLAAPHEAVAR